LKSSGDDGDKETRITVALALARSGATDNALQVAANLDQDLPNDTLWKNYHFPLIRAAVELQRREPGRSIELLKVAVPYELGGGDPSYLYPAYIRGLAFIQAGNWQEAVREFQKMVDHPGVALQWVTGALAHLQLGRAQVMMGDKEAARKSYQNFLTLWKDADPDIPIYQQAKAEYKKLVVAGN
jgi:tetratricopeptide (TPR) repeat protein